MIAPGKGEGFADIFEGNAFNNGLLPIELAAGRLGGDRRRRPDSPGAAEVTIDLERPDDHAPPGDGRANRFAFEVPEAQRNRLLKGLDAIAETLLNEAAIRAHERNTPAWVTPQPAGRLTP